MCVTLCLLLLVWILVPFKNIYEDLVKDDWAQNISVLFFCGMLSLIFLAFGVQMAMNRQEYIFPVYLLVLILEILWAWNLSQLAFEMQVIIGWCIFCLTLSISVSIWETKAAIATVSFLVISLGQLSLSYGLWFNNGTL